MAREEEGKIPRPKISDEFAARLERLGPHEEVRAIVMLATARPRAALKKRLSPRARQAAVKHTRRSLAEALPDIDLILKEHQGRRLKGALDVLGAVPVVTTPAGIKALTASEHVRAVFEDQAIFRVA